MKQITRFGSYGLLMISSFSFSTMSIDPFILHGRGGLQSGLTPLNLPVKEKKTKSPCWLGMYVNDSIRISLKFFDESRINRKRHIEFHPWTPRSWAAVFFQLRLSMLAHLLKYFGKMKDCVDDCGWYDGMNAPKKFLGYLVWRFSSATMQLMLKSPTWIKDVLKSILQRPIRFPSMHKWWNTYPPPRSTDPLLSNTFFLL